MPSKLLHSLPVDSSCPAALSGLTHQMAVWPFPASVVPLLVTVKVGGVHADSSITSLVTWRAKQLSWDKRGGSEEF
jgi:hypothetical protein